MYTLEVSATCLGIVWVCGHQHEACGHLFGYFPTEEGLLEKTSILLNNALVDMYAKCGALINV